MGTANHALVHGAGVEPARCSCTIYSYCTSNKRTSGAASFHFVVK